MGYPMGGLECKNPTHGAPLSGLVLRDRLGTLGDLSESFRTATWLKNIVLKALGYLLAFLRKGTWLKSVVLEERLTVPDYLLERLPTEPKDYSAQNKF